MNKVIASTLAAAAFGLSVTACAGETSDNQPTDDVKVAYDKDGNLLATEEQPNNKDEKTVTPKRCMLASVNTTGCACW